MSITALPSPPLPTDVTSVFNTKAFALLSALVTFVTEANALQVDANTQAATATAKAILTAADRVQTGLDRTQTGLDRVQTGLDAVAAAAMDKRYLGAKSTAPTLDNQGAALQAGAVYYDTTTLKVMTWSGSAWVEGISAVAGVSSINGLTGAVAVPIFPDFLLFNLGVI